MSAVIIPFKTQSVQPKACSFCKTPEASAKKLIEGINGHCICDKCIAGATELLNKADPVEAS